MQPKEVPLPQSNEAVLNNNKYWTIPVNEQTDRTRNLISPLIKSNLDLQSEMKEKSNVLIELLRENGEIVWDRNPENIEQVCVLLKQAHGHTEDTTKKSISNPQYGQEFFAHQNAIKQAMGKVELVSNNNLHLFLEHFPSESEDEIIKRRWNEKNRAPWIVMEEVAEAIAANPTAAFNFFLNLQRYMDKGINTDRTFESFTGGERFLVELMESGVSWYGRVHGMGTEERRSFIGSIGTESPSREIEKNIRDLVHTHEHLTSILERWSQPSRFHIVELGGGHFKPRKKNEKETLFDKIREIKGQFALELYLNASHKLANTRFIVLEPHFYTNLVP